MNLHAKLLRNFYQVGFLELDVNVIRAILPIQRFFNLSEYREVLTASRLRVVRPHFSSGIIERAKTRPRVKITPREKGELAFRSLYYPWGKKGTTRSPDRERSSFFNINFVIATRGERKSEIMQVSRKADLNLILVAARINRFNFRILYSLMESWGYAWPGLTVIKKNTSTEPVNCESLSGYAQRFWANFKFLVIDARTAEENLKKLSDKENSKTTVFFLPFFVCTGNKNYKLAAT